MHAWFGVGVGSRTRASSLLLLARRNSADVTTLTDQTDLLGQCRSLLWHQENKGSQQGAICRRYKVNEDNRPMWTV